MKHSAQIVTFLSALRLAYGSMPLEPAETRPRSNFPESRNAFFKVRSAKLNTNVTILMPGTDYFGETAVIVNKRSHTCRHHAEITQSHTALVRLSTTTRKRINFSPSTQVKYHRITEKRSLFANKHVLYTRPIQVPECRVTRSTGTTLALFSHQKKTTSWPGSKFTCKFALT